MRAGMRGPGRTAVISGNSSIRACRDVGNVLMVKKEFGDPCVQG